MIGEWIILDYVELIGRNPIRDWLDDLSEGDRARVDYRLIGMQSSAKWPDKWVSKYRGTKENLELRIFGNKIQCRPLAAYHGHKTLVLLAGAFERGGRIPKSNRETAERRLDNLRSGKGGTIPHQFDDDIDLEEDAAEGI